ncbi:MAG: VOC family protein [Bacteroidota bacterium]
MKEIKRLITNICTDDVQSSKYFYTKILDFQVAFDSDWYVQLIATDKSYELGLISRSSEVIPVDYQKQPQGFYLTFVVDSADDVYEISKEEGFEVIEEPTDTFYGQRRLLLKDPDGTMVDISSIIQ